MPKSPPQHPNTSVGAEWVDRHEVASRINKKNQTALALCPQKIRLEGA